VSRRRYLGLAVVVLVLIAIIVSIAFRSTGNGGSVRAVRARSVIIIGDSMVGDSKPSLRAALSDYRLTIGWRVGDEGAVLLPAIRAAVRRQPDALIIEGGSDDAFGGNLHWRQGGFDPTVKAVEHLPCVIWTTLPVFVDYYHALKVHGPLLSIGKDWNAALRATVSANPHFHLVDIAPLGHAPYLGPDGVHPTFPGREWLARQYATAVADCLSATAK
jgi:hypothetical protein